MDFHAPRTLGRTGLMAGRLGLAASFGAETEAFEEAFERGCNYFYWGSIRRDTMRQAILNLCARGRRDDLIIVLQSYSRSPRLLELFIQKGLRALSLDAADVLLLGWYNKPPSPRIIDRALALKEKGLVRFLGLSGHNRELFPRLAHDGTFDLFHVRYNAAHRGAETEVFAKLQTLPDEERPGLVTYTATRWRHLLEARKMPPGEPPASAPDCYRFALSHPAVDVALCGAKNLEEMRQDLRVLDLGPLGPEEMARMKKIGDHIHAHSRVFK
jgi:aryl-alcohol dehydrogenase-like predicted oxidoreductase